MRWKGVALSVSWGIIILCTLIVRPWNEPNPRVKLGMQFVGGNDMTVRFSPPIKPEQVRSALAAAGFTDSSVVPYAENKAGFQDYAVKVRARKTGDQLDSTKQSAELKDVFRKLDQERAGSTLPSLNLEGSGTLTDRLVAENPMKVQGDGDAIRQAYEPLASQVTAQRDKLPGAMYKDLSQLPAGLPQDVKDTVSKDYRPGSIKIAKDESFSPSISGEWTAKTLKAVLWASVAILIYIMFRFTLSFAIGGIVSSSTMCSWPRAVRRVRLRVQCGGGGEFPHAHGLFHVRHHRRLRPYPREQPQARIQTQDHHGAGERFH